jgi:hypothetical protein
MLAYTILPILALRAAVGVAGGVAEEVIVAWVAVVVVSMSVVIARGVGATSEGVVETTLGLLLGLALIRSVGVTEVLLELFRSGVIVGKKAGAVAKMLVGVLSLQAAKPADSSNPIVIIIREENRLTCQSLSLYILLKTPVCTKKLI